MATASEPTKLMSNIECHNEFVFFFPGAEMGKRSWNLIWRIWQYCSL